MLITNIKQYNAQEFRFRGIPCHRINRICDANYQIEAYAYFESLKHQHRRFYLYYTCNIITKRGENASMNLEVYFTNKYINCFGVKMEKEFTQHLQKSLQKTISDASEICLIPYIVGLEKSHTRENYNPLLIANNIELMVKFSEDIGDFDTSDDVVEKPLMH